MKNHDSNLDFDWQRSFSGMIIRPSLDISYFRRTELNSIWRGVWHSQSTVGIWTVQPMDYLTVKFGDDFSVGIGYLN